MIAARHDLEALRNRLVVRMLPELGIGAALACRTFQLGFSPNLGQTSIAGIVLGVVCALFVRRRITADLLVTRWAVDGPWFAAPVAVLGLSFVPPVRDWCGIVEMTLIASGLLAMQRWWTLHCVESVLLAPEPREVPPLLPRPARPRSTARAAGVHVLALEAGAQPKCLVCGDEIATQPVPCAKCRALYHSQCFAYVDTCAVYGCGEPFDGRSARS